MSTAYKLGPTVAHVMRFIGSGVWRPLCSYGDELDMKDRDSYGKLQWSHGSENQPAKPWCHHCKLRVAEMAQDVLRSGRRGAT